jgi:hypothetical protein
MYAATRSPGLDAGRAQRLREPRHFVVQLGVGHAAFYAVLAPEHDGGLGVAPAQQVFGEIQARLREPARAGHAVRVLERDVPLALGDYAAEVPQQPVELLWRGDRPCMQRRVIGEAGAILARSRAHEGGHVAGGDRCRGRLPDRGAHEAGVGFIRDAFAETE